MARPTILVASRFLIAERARWAEGYDLVGPDTIDDPAAAHFLRSIEVVVSDGESLDRRLIEALPSLALVACFSTGYAGIDVGLLRSRGIALTHGGGVNAHDVADHAIALLLSWWHGIPNADRAVRDGSWRTSVTPRPSLRGRRMGIVGLGRIGLQVARRAEAFGLLVKWWGPNERAGCDYPRSSSLLELASDSDILVITSRAIPANAGQIDSRVLAALGRKGLLINVSRGFLVDEPALLRALESREIAGAALDVFAAEPPDAAAWKRLGNVVLSPHIAGFTREGGVALFAQLRENLRRHFAGEPLLTPVDEPVH